MRTINFDKSINTNHLINLLHKYPTKPWNWYGISSNPNTPIQFIIDNPDKPWDWYGVSSNQNLTMQFILDNPTKSWDWFALSKHENITIQNKLDNPTLLWEEVFPSDYYCYNPDEYGVYPLINIQFIILSFTYSNKTKLNDISGKVLYLK